MGETLDISLLRTFRTVAECRGFTPAAAVLRLSQPAVSQHIRLLEERTGLTLINRRARDFSLTIDGDRVLEEAQTIVDAHDAALVRLRAGSAPQLKLGMASHVARRIGSPLLADLREDNPAVRVHLRIAAARELNSDLAQGSLDIALTLEHSREAPGRTVGSFELRWLAAQTANRPTGKGTPLPLVVSDYPCRLSDRARSALAAAGLEYSVVAESSSVDGVLAAVHAGLGVALLPVSQELESGLVKWDELPAMGRIGVRLNAREGMNPTVVNEVAASVEALIRS